MRHNYLSFKRDDERYVEKALSRQDEKPKAFQFNSTDEEIAVMIGLYRQGNDFTTIGAFFHLTSEQVETIVTNYLKGIKE